MLKRIAAAAIAALALFATSAHAQEEMEFFVALGAGQVSVALDDVPFDESGTGYRALGGVRFNPYFGMEAGYWDGATAELKSATAAAEISPISLSVVGVGRYPFFEYFSVFGKLGVTFYRLEIDARIGPFVFDDSESGSELTYGGGLSARVWRNFEVRGEWDRYAFSIDDEDGNTSTISLSVVYNF